MWNLEDILADIENKEALEDADMIGDGSDSNTANNNKVSMGAKQCWFLEIRTQ